jgi:HSP20 family protein
MLSRWNDYNDPFAVLGAFRQQFDRLFDDYAGDGALGDGAGPRLHLFDTKEALVMMADVPGLREKDINLSVNQDVFTIAGERKASAPEGYIAHRQERSSYRFSRSFSLPAKVDLERTQAIVKNGVLTVTMPKAPEAQPRQIAIRAGHLFYSERKEIVP